MLLWLYMKLWGTYLIVMLFLHSVSKAPGETETDTPVRTAVCLEGRSFLVSFQQKRPW